MANTFDDLVHDLAQLGVQRGSALLVHASFKSLGAVEGGAATVIEAFETALGPEGTLLMPSFNMASRDRDVRAAWWNPETTPSTAGYLTEYFRQLPGSCRSDHYSHSVAARGAQAQWLTEGHRAQEGMVSPWDGAPWGRTYGTHSPFMRALDAGARVLLLGVDCRCLTYIHLAEVIDYNRRLAEDISAPYRFADRAAVDAWWASRGDFTAGTVGDARCILFDAATFVEALTSALRQELNAWLVA